MLLDAEVAHLSDLATTDSRKPVITPRRRSMQEIERTREAMADYYRRYNVRLMQAMANSPVHGRYQR